MSIGPQIEFPFLEKLHLYRFGDYMKQSGDEERYMDHKEYLIIWQLYMSNIREVALTSNTIWSSTTDSGSVSWGSNPYKSTY